MEKFKKSLKLIIALVIIFLFIWFLILSPYVTFKKNEKTMQKAAERYYQLNLSKLPTGKRTSTVTLQQLYRDSYIKEDFYIPYSKAPCSLTESWVKVKHGDNGYEYYTYLECGALKSTTDHKGPTIVLNGDKEMTINVDEKYQEPGIKSINDNTDGKMDEKDVTIDNSKVDTTKTGTYKVTYTAIDSFNNKTVETRKVNVVQELKNTVKKNTKSGIYTGDVENNYIRFSGMVFRIVGLDGNNVKIVSEGDVANVNHDAIEEWLEYYYKHINAESKKYVVDSKYCQGTTNKDDISTNTSCGTETKKKSVYILSSKDMTASFDENGKSYLLPGTISWLADKANDKEAWSTRSFFVDSEEKYMSFPEKYNFGVRPVLTIKGDILINKGSGTKNDPYDFGDIIPGKDGEKVNTRQSGEYITYSDYLWRIVETNSDGTTKLICDSTIKIPGFNNGEIAYESNTRVNIYNPNKKGNVGYTINQKSSDAVSGKYLVKYKVKVPIYKKVSEYQKEIETKEYTVKYSAPNIYDLYSIDQSELNNGYWYINSSKEENRLYTLLVGGVVNYDYSASNTKAGIKPIVYLDKNCSIVSGKGTKGDPYKIAK